MSTEAQSSANRANAEKSTGPKSPEGKQRSRINAFRHGLTGQICVLTAEDSEAFARHCRGIHDSLHPRGPLETDITQSIADDRWRLARAKALENSIFALGLENQESLSTGNSEVDVAFSQARTWLTQSHNLELLTLYEQRIQRSVEKSHRQLHALQSERRAAHQQAIEEATLLARLAQSKGETYDPATDFDPTILGNGFVYSPADFAAAMGRHRRLEEARTLSKKLSKAA